MKSCYKCDAEPVEDAEICACGAWFRAERGLDEMGRAPVVTRISSTPTWLILSALAAAVVASIMAQSMQMFGSRSAIGAALSNSTVAFNLIVPAILVVLMFPAVHVGVASIFERYRNSESRRSIFFWWGMGITIVQGYVYFGSPPAS